MTRTAAVWVPALLIASLVPTATAQPANDDPSGAVPLTVGMTFPVNAVVGSNVGATASEIANPSIPNPGCGAYAGADVWYTVIVPPAGNVNLETQPDGSSTFYDSGIAVYSGHFLAFTLEACDDDGGMGTFSLISLSGRVPGETLYLRVWHYGGTNEGTFQVSAWEPSVPVELQSFSIE